jgi:hypothetical protein
MDDTTLVLLAYLLGVLTGVALMAVSIAFVASHRGLMGSIGLRVSQFELLNAPVAVVFFIVGAGLFAGTLYLVITRADDSQEPRALPGAGKLDADLISASSSSFHPSDRGITYSPRNTLDGNRNTAWNADGPGPGESLHFEFARPVRLRRIDLVNGYAKDRLTFGGNARLRNVTFVVDARTLRRTLRDSMQWQSVRARFGVTTSLTIEVQSVYPGSRPDWNDAALTEIRFWRAHS